MEYTVQKLARLAGVSARTLRYYDEIGLLKPARTSTSGYRIYGESEVDALQQILFFRTLGLELETIAAIMRDPSFDRLSALRTHLGALEAKKAQLDRLIDTVHRTIEKEEGGRPMTDQEKFEGLKQTLLEENESKYGKEIRQRYGEDVVEASNRKFKGMRQDQYEAMQRMAGDILQALTRAVTEGEAPDGDTGREIALLHKQWLAYTWPEYNRDAHLGLVEMYLSDERFTAYYDAQTPGNAQFLRDAVVFWKDAL